MNESTTVVSQLVSLRTVRLKEIKTFIKVVDECGDKKNNGLITMRKRKPVWLSLKLPNRSPSYLIGEIKAAGGDFLGEIGYKPSVEGKAICDSGTGYEGGVPFSNLDEAFDYLARFFNVQWCDGREPKAGEREANASTHAGASASVSPSGVSTTPSAPLSCVASLLATLLSKSPPTTFDFCQCYLALQKCLGHRSVQFKGAGAHLESSWPNHPGVYVVHDLQKKDLYDGIIYVGMTGKLTRLSAQMTGKLKFRPRRWDPYSFQNGSFAYGFNRRKRTYTQTILAGNYRVDCFIFDSSGLEAPCFLEAVLLQAYALVGKSRLPPANNAF
jgi:hypothetical protein